MMNFILFDVWGGGKIIIYIYKLFYIIDIFYLIIKKTQLLILKGGPWGGASIYIYIDPMYIYVCVLYTYICYIYYTHL